MSPRRLVPLVSALSRLRWRIQRLLLDSSVIRRQYRAVGRSSVERVTVREFPVPAVLAFPDFFPPFPVGFLAALQNLVALPLEFPYLPFRASAVVVRLEVFAVGSHGPARHSTAPFAASHPTTD